MTRLRTAFAVTIALATAALLAAPVEAQQPRRGGVLAASMDLQPRSLDPIMGDAPTSDRYLLLQIYEALLRFDAEGNLQPALAESWAFAPDGRSITFKIREGVVFHDGTSFDAKAAAWNLERAMDPKVNAPRRSDLAALAGVEATGPFELKVTLKEPSGAALSALAVEAGMMASPTAVQASGQDFGRKPVGTGPFRFEEWVSGTSVTLRRFDRYWRKDDAGQPLPYLDGVTMRFITQPAVKMVELKSGSVHLSDSITPRDIPEIEKASDLKLLKVPPGITQFMAFNASAKPFDDVRVRRAVLHAINPEVMMRVVSGQYGAVTPTVAAPGEWIYDGSLPKPTQDVAAARRLLAEAGFANGFTMTISVIQREPDTQIAQLMQAQLRQAGITANVEILERQAWLDKVLNKRHEAAMLRANVPRPDPDQTFGPFFGRNAAFNWSAVQDEALFDAVARAARATEQKDRRAAYVEAQKILLEKAYYAFLFFREAPHVHRAEVQNLRFDIGGAWLLSQAWLAR
jgi:peptide/nickel transport system substrate-binding protein